MSLTVYKYLIAPWCRIVEMPSGARPLHVGVQDGEAYLWALVERPSATVQREVWVVPTGGDVPPTASYVGSFHLAEPSGELVNALSVDDMYESWEEALLPTRELVEAAEGLHEAIRNGLARAERAEEEAEAHQLERIWPEVGK